MTEAEVAAIVEKAVQQTLLTMGIDTSDPAEMQRDFQHLRAWRESVETVKRQGLITAVGVIVTGVIGGIVLWIKGGI